MSAGVRSMRDAHSHISALKTWCAATTLLVGKRSRASDPGGTSLVSASDARRASGEVASPVSATSRTPSGCEAPVSE
eukprot:3262656-Prymnesium_polylepis.1